MKPTLNEQSKFDHLTLLRKGITCCFINLIDTIPNSIYCIKLLFPLIYEAC